MIRRFARPLKSLAERTLGVTIARTPPAPVNKHADSELRQLREWSSTDVMFDVGANDGRTILRLQHQLSQPRIFAFEPVAATFRTLVARTAHLQNVRAFQLGLGAESGQSTIYLSTIDAMNSLAPGWTEDSVATEVVTISTVDQVMAEHDVDFVHFLKIDTEGYELEVLRGAERALSASRVGIIQVEVGVDQMDRRFLPLEDARRHLAARGYLLYGIYNQCRTPARAAAEWADRPGKGGMKPMVLGYCDALFIRADR